MRKFLPIAAVLYALFLICSCDPTTGPSVPTPPDPGAKTRLRSWIMSSLDDMATYTGAANETDRTIQMAIGEYEHLQLRIFAKDSTALEIKRMKDNPEVDFSVRTFAPFNGFDDEVLVPCKNKVRPDSSRDIRLWLSFRLNHKAAPNSTYQETITFTGGKYICTIKVKILSGSAVLPATPRIPSVFGVWPDGTPDKAKMVDLLLDYRVSPFFFKWENDGHSIECTSSPYEYGTKEYWECLSDERFAAIAMPSHEVSDANLKKMYSEADSLSLAGKLYYYIVDEPLNLDHIAKVKDQADRIHALADTARVLTTFYKGPEDGPYAGEILSMFDYLDFGKRDIFSVVYDTDGASTPTYIAKLKDQQEYWGYVTSVNYPGISVHSNRFDNRAVMWRLYNDGGTGFLYWAVNFFDSINPIVYHLNKLDAALVFPGEDFGVEDLCVSIRFERWRDGQEDCELLCNYADKHGSQAAKQLLSTVYTAPKTLSHSVPTIEEFHNTLVERF